MVFDQTIFSWMLIGALDKSPRRQGPSCVLRQFNNYGFTEPCPVQPKRVAPTTLAKWDTQLFSGLNATEQHNARMICKTDGTDFAAPVSQSWLNSTRLDSTWVAFQHPIWLTLPTKHSGTCRYLASIPLTYKQLQITIYELPRIRTSLKENEFNKCLSIY